jgi:hypothetical protein
MSFLNGARQFIDERRKALEKGANCSVQELDFDFSLQNCAKKSFYLLVTKPFSKRVMKIAREISLTIM